MLPPTWVDAWMNHSRPNVGSRRIERARVAVAVIDARMPAGWESARVRGGAQGSRRGVSAGPHEARSWSGGTRGNAGPFGPASRTRATRQSDLCFAAAAP